MDVNFSNVIIDIVFYIWLLRLFLLWLAVKCEYICSYSTVYLKLNFLELVDGPISPSVLASRPTLFSWSFTFCAYQMISDYTVSNFKF